jgi:peptidyl-prolyl cis-trans isomerase A (cyclophilin A)
MRRLLFLATTLLLCFNVTATVKDGAHIQPDNLFPKVKMSTSMGDLVLELDRSKAEITVNNFLRYAANGSYNDTVFHRIIENYIVQGGGYDKEYQQLATYPPIVNESGNGLENDFGTIAMAREREAHSATRQFFFNANDNDYLNPGRNWGYTVFGSIVEGDEVLEKMHTVQTHMDATLLWPDVPIKPVVLHTVTILPQE